MADDWQGLQVIDTTIIDSPTLYGFYDTPGYGIDVAVKDELIYVADWLGEFIILSHNASLIFPDLWIDEVTPVQVVEGVDLVLNKATAVKVVVHKDGLVSMRNVSLRLTHDDLVLSTFYVYDTNNLNTDFSLKSNNSTFPLSFLANETEKTVYFFDDKLKTLQFTLCYQCEGR